MWDYMWEKYGGDFYFLYKNFLSFFLYTILVYF
jgi:hypothetical protein